MAKGMGGARNAGLDGLETNRLASGVGSNVSDCIGGFYT